MAFGLTYWASTRPPRPPQPPPAAGGFGVGRRGLRCGTFVSADRAHLIHVAAATPGANQNGIDHIAGRRDEVYDDPVLGPRPMELARPRAWEARRNDARRSRAFMRGRAVIACPAPIRNTTGPDVRIDDVARWREAETAVGARATLLTLREVEARRRNRARRSLVFCSSSGCVPTNLVRADASRGAWPPRRARAPLVTTAAIAAPCPDNLSVCQFCS